MLIRSQDGDVLVCLENLICLRITMYDDFRDLFTINFVTETDNCSIGDYSTEEKAQKVLDDITYHYEHLGETYIKPYRYYGNVFQMPKDEEVQIDG